MARTQAVLFSAIGPAGAVHPDIGRLFAGKAAALLPVPGTVAAMSFRCLLSVIALRRPAGLRIGGLWLRTVLRLECEQGENEEDKNLLHESSSVS